VIGTLIWFYASNVISKEGRGIFGEGKIQIKSDACPWFFGGVDTMLESSFYLSVGVEGVEALLVGISAVQGYCWINFNVICGF